MIEPEVPRRHRIVHRPTHLYFQQVAHRQRFHRDMFFPLIRIHRSLAADGGIKLLDIRRRRLHHAPVRFPHPHVANLQRVEAGSERIDKQSKVAHSSLGIHSDAHHRIARTFSVRLIVHLGLEKFNDKGRVCRGRRRSRRGLPSFRFFRRSGRRLLTPRVRGKEGKRDQQQNNRGLEHSKIPLMLTSDDSNPEKTIATGIYGLPRKKRGTMARAPVSEVNCKLAQAFAGESPRVKPGAGRISGRTTFGSAAGAPWGGTVGGVRGFSGSGLPSMGSFTSLASRTSRTSNACAMLSSVSLCVERRFFAAS